MANYTAFNIWTLVESMRLYQSKHKDLMIKSESVRSADPFSLKANQKADKIAKEANDHQQTADNMAKEVDEVISGLHDSVMKQVQETGEALLPDMLLAKHINNAMSTLKEVYDKGGPVEVTYAYNDLKLALDMLEGKEVTNE